MWNNFFSRSSFLRFQDRKYDTQVKGYHFVGIVSLMMEKIFYCVWNVNLWQENLTSNLFRRFCFWCHRRWRKHFEFSLVHEMKKMSSKMKERFRVLVHLHVKGKWYSTLFVCTRKTRNKRTHKRAFREITEKHEILIAKHNYDQLRFKVSVPNDMQTNGHGCVALTLFHEYWNSNFEILSPSSLKNSS